MDTDGGHSDPPKSPTRELAMNHGKRRAKTHNGQAKAGTETQRAKEDAKTHTGAPKTNGKEDAETHTGVTKTKTHKNSDNKTHTGTRCKTHRNPTGTRAKGRADRRAKTYNGQAKSRQAKRGTETQQAKEDAETHAGEHKTHSDPPKTPTGELAMDDTDGGYYDPLKNPTGTRAKPARRTQSGEEGAPREGGRAHREGQAGGGRQETGGVQTEGET